MKELLQSLCTEVCEGKVQEAFTNACWLIHWLLLTLYLLELDSPLNHFDSKSQVSCLSEIHIAWYVNPLNKQLTFNLSSFQTLHQELRESRSWKRPRSRSQGRAGTGRLSPFTSSSTQLPGPEAPDLPSTLMLVLKFLWICYSWSVLSEKTTNLVLFSNSILNDTHESQRDSVVWVHFSKSAN